METKTKVIAAVAGVAFIGLFNVAFGDDAPEDSSSETAAEKTSTDAETTPAPESAAPDPEPAEPADVELAGDGFGAEVICEEFVKQRLNFPGTAEFSDQDHQPSDEEEFWIVTGTVEADNASGQTQLANYRCNLTYDEGDEEWTASDVFLQ